VNRSSKHAAWIVALFVLGACPSCGLGVGSSPATHAGSISELTLRKTDLPLGWSAKAAPRLDLDFGRLGLALLSECFSGPDPATAPAVRSPTFSAPDLRILRAFSLAIALPTARDANIMWHDVSAQGPRCFQKVEETIPAGIAKPVVRLKLPDRRAVAFRADQIFHTNKGDENQHIVYVAVSAGNGFSLLSFESAGKPFPLKIIQQAVTAMLARIGTPDRLS